MKKMICLMLFLLVANIVFAQANKKGKYDDGPDDVPVGFKSPWIKE